MTPLALALLGLPAALASAYLLLLTLYSRAPVLPPPAPRRQRFSVLVPAHDEAAVIERTLASLAQLDWPRQRLHVLVLADNCSDATAAKARAAGAEVLERRDPLNRGKGRALEYGLRVLAQRKWADAIVVVDADSQVSRNLLDAFAARLELGAQVVQARYEVLNPNATWRTRLMSLALACFHVLRSRARERLGLSCGIRGNGWCVTRRLLRELPYRCFSLAEDLEYGIALGLEGRRVYYADDARVCGEMAAREPAARAQCRRWEDGRFGLIRTRSLPLLRTALRRRDALCLDLALDLLVLPLSYIAVLLAAFTAAAAVAAQAQPALSGWLWLALACDASLALYVLRGWQLSGLGAQGLLDLARAPFYVAWKLLAMLTPHQSTEWIRTRREPL